MQENHQDLEKLRKELRMTRIFNGITTIILVCALVGGFRIFSKVQGYIDTAMPLVAKVSEVEFDVLNQSMENLNKTLESIDWEKISTQLEQLDMDALNEAIAGLNTEELSKALENLNEVSASLESFSGSIKDFFSKFGSGINFGGF